MSILKIALANIRRRKGAAFTFLGMVFLASLMLCVSLALVTGTSNFYEKKVDELNAPHYTNLIRTDKYKPEFFEFAEKHAVLASEVETLLTFGDWHMKGGGTKSGFTVIFIGEKHSEEKSFYNPPIIDKKEISETNRIALPIGFKTSGFRSGDNITLTVGEQNIDFKIFGFYEDAVAGASTFTTSICFIDDDFFKDLRTGGTLVETTMVVVRLENSSKVKSFSTEFSRLTSHLTGIETFVISFDQTKASSMMFVDMVSMMLLIFALIVLAIAFIVVSFSIGSSIAEDLSTIGVLKSVGYKNLRLRLTQIVQYLMIAIVGSVLGGVFSLLTFGLIGNIIASTSGLLWLSAVNFLPAILSVLIICALTLLISFTSTRKYKKITPIKALRQEQSHKTKTKNTLPLDKSNLHLDIHLGLKRFLGGTKNNLILFAVCAMLVFMSLIVNVMNHNLNVDRTAMIKMVGLEFADIWVMPTSDSIVIRELNDEILEKDPDVDKTLLVVERTCFIGDYETFVTSFEDFDKLTVNTIVKGDYPKAANEVAIGANTSRSIGKGIGATISVETSGKVKEYTIVGITQSIGNFGEGLLVTFDGLENHIGSFDPGHIYVYLKEGVSPKLYKENLEIACGTANVMVIDADETMDTILSSIGDPVALLFTILMVANVIIVAFVLFLILTTILRKSQREFGIMKAIGYTNRRLVLQLLVSLLPSLILGTATGIAFGFIFSNLFLGMMFSSMGLLKAYFIVPALSSLLFAFLIFGAGVLSAYLLSFRLKKISPQKLLVT